MGGISVSERRMVGIPRRLHGVGVLVALAALATTQGVQAAAVLDLVQDTEGREIGGCERSAQTHNIYMRAMKKWDKRRASIRNRQRKNVANNVFYKLQALAYSKRAKESLVDKCVQDYYRRAIYRHEARHLVSKAILDGHRKVIKSKGKLARFYDRYKCEKTMFRAVRPLWKEGGNKLKYSKELCKRMKEEWTSKLEVAAKAVKSIMSYSHCNKNGWLGRMRRAEYMVEGINISCKKFKRTSGRDKRKLRAHIRKAVAAYTVASLQTNGRERYQNSLRYLSGHPVYRRAAALLRKRTKELQSLANVG